MNEQQKNEAIGIFKDLLKTLNKEQLDIISEFLIKRFDEDNNINMSDKQRNTILCQVKAADRERIINDLVNYLNL